MPASISSKIIVAPPPTAAMASAILDSSPPEAVCATGASGKPGFGLMRNVTSSAPLEEGSRSPSSATNSPSPMPIDSSSADDGRGERRRRRPALLGESRDELVHAALCVLERFRRGGDGVDAVRERIELGAGRDRRSTSSAVVSTR